MNIKVGDLVRAPRSTLCKDWVGQVVHRSDNPSLAQVRYPDQPYATEMLWTFGVGELELVVVSPGSAEGPQAHDH